MKNPGFQSTLMRVVGAILWFALSGGLRADPPANAPGTQALIPAPRTQPQIIYRVRPTSEYAARLHSQDKSRNNELPIDSSMPTSLQLSRANANARARAEAEAARANEQAAILAQEQAAPSERRPKRLRIQRSPGPRPQFSVRPRGHGGGNGNKGHKRH